MKCTLQLFLERHTRQQMKQSKPEIVLELTASTQRGLRLFQNKDAISGAINLDLVLKGQASWSWCSVIIVTHPSSSS